MNVASAASVKKKPFYSFCYVKLGTAMCYVNIKCCYVLCKNTLCAMCYVEYFAHCYVLCA